MQNYEKFYQNITVLGELFEKQLSESMIELYWNAFDELTDEDFDGACRVISKSHKYNTFPKPAEFIEVVHGSSEDRLALEDQKSYEALLKLENAISKFGYYDSVQFDDPIMHKTVEHLGGWQNISTQEHEQWTWTKKDFIKIYKVLEKRGVTSDCPPKLVGFFEQDNINRGTLERIADHLKPQTQYIGQEKIAQIERKQGS